MLRIRLRRVGARKQPSYRVVVAERHTPRDGRFIEHIGYYNPRTEPISFRIDEERVLYWLSQGAQPSKAVERLLKKGDTLERLARLKAGESLDALLAEARRKSEVEPADASARGSDAGAPEIIEEPEE